MAQLDTGGGGGGGKHQKQRAKKQSTHIDMTPMVDLAFLLLTFFVLTSTFSKPVTMEITMPVDKGEKTDVKHIITLLLTGGDTVGWYYGVLDTAKADPISVSSYGKDGIRKVLAENNKETIKQIQEIEKNMLADK